MLAILPTFYPSTIVGVVRPLQRLHQEGWLNLDLSLQHLVSADAIRAADVVVMCGEALAPVPRILKWIAELGRPLVFELDDNRLEVPANLPGMDYARNPVQRNRIIDCLRTAAAVRVYSSHLKELVAPYCSSVALVAGPVAWELLDDTAAEPRAATKIVYATSRVQDRIGEMLVAPLNEVLSRFPQAELTVWGPSNPFVHHPRVRHRRFLRNYDRFFRQFSREHFEIGLAPLPDDAFHRGKSNNKFREYAACGIAGVYSDMPVYNTCVTHGSTGLLVGEDPAAWLDAIGALINDPFRRKRIATQAHQYAREHYSDAVIREGWMSIFSNLGERRTVSAVASQPALSAPAQRWSIGKLARTSVNAVASAHRRESWRRLADYTTSVAAIVGWRLRRRRLP